jgi:hypothetical protein
MIGSGIFVLPRRFGDATGLFDARIAWAVAGGGMFTPARVFQSHARQEPDLDAGVYGLVAGWLSVEARSSWKQSRAAAMSLPGEQE